jgi:hypothetical protein
MQGVILWEYLIEPTIVSANSVYRKSFTFHPQHWMVLKEIALARGFRSRNAMIVATLKGIIADHQQAKNQDTA